MTIQTTAEPATQRRRGPARAARPVAELYAEPAALNITDAGDYLGVSPDTAYRLAQSGRLPVPIHRVGVQWRVLRADLIRFLDPDGYADPDRRTASQPPSPSLTRAEAGAAARLRGLAPNVTPASEDVSIVLRALDRLAGR